jgi:hypothetical protein
MRTKGNGKVVLTSTPKGGGWASAMGWAAKYYQQNQTQKNPNFDTNRKLVIQNYAKDLGSGVFWGWDVIAADETDENYLFQLRNRENGSLRVYITLGRELQVSDLENNLYQMYQCYIHDDLAQWDKRFWLDAKDINHKTFWGMIEKIVDGYHPLLPF